MISFILFFSLGGEACHNMADNGRGVLVSHNKNDVEAAVRSIQCTYAVKLHAYSLKVAYGGLSSSSTVKRPKT